MDPLYCHRCGYKTVFSAKGITCLVCGPVAAMAKGEPVDAPHVSQATNGDSQAGIVQRATESSKEVKRKPRMQEA